VRDYFLSRSLFSPFQGVRLPPSLFIYFKVLPLTGVPMTKKVVIELDDADYERIVSFKRVFDAIMEEETSLNDYFTTILAVGYDSMLSDVMPQEREILVEMLKAINRKDPQFFTDFMVNMLKRSEERAEKLKEKVRSETVRYIS